MKKRISMKQALKINAQVCRKGGWDEERLREKCKWEHMTRTAVIMEFGDPRLWNFSLTETISGYVVTFTRNAADAEYCSDEPLPEKDQRKNFIAEMMQRGYAFTCKRKSTLFFRRAS